MQNFLSDYPFAKTCVRVAQKLKGAFVRPKIRRKSIPVFFYDIAGFFLFSWNNHTLYFQMKRNIAIFIIILMMVMVTAPIEAHYLYVPKKKTWLETKFDNVIEVCMYYVSDDKLCHQMMIWSAETKICPAGILYFRHRLREHSHKT